VFNVVTGALMLVQFTVMVFDRKLKEAGVPLTP
jgi:hypothetical protein